jgi:flagellar hook-length control protein FliK
MHAANTVNQVPKAPSYEGAEKGAVTPETEGFDFMNYLLGLQVETPPSEESTTTDSSLGNILQSLDSTVTPEAKKNSDKEESALASLFPGLALPEMNFSKEPLAKPPPEPVGMSDAQNLFEKSGDAESRGVNPNEIARKQDLAQGVNPLDNAQNAGDAKEVSENTLTSGLRAFQSQLNATQALTESKKDKHSTSSDSSDGGDVAIPQQLTMTTSNEVFAPESSVKPDVAQNVDVPDLFSKVDSLIQQGGGSMKVTLNPPELGAIEVQVSTQGKHVQVELKSESDFTKSVLESKLGDLRNSIQSQDLVVSKLEVNVSKDLSRDFGNTWTPSGQQAFSGFSDQSKSQFQNQSNSPRSNWMNENRRDVSSVGRASNVNYSPRVNLGRLDVRI